MKATLLILCIYITRVKTYPPKLSNRGVRQDRYLTETLIKMAIDVIQDTTRRISVLQNMHRYYADSAPFEIGYVSYIIQDKYRRMVDLYNTSVFMGRKLYILEHVLYLQDIEHIYWEINHLTSMLHEIERKYGKQTRLDIVYDEFLTTTTAFSAPTSRTSYIRTPKTTGYGVDKYLMQGFYSTRRKRRRTWWPLEYGWEIDYYW